MPTLVKTIMGGKTRKLGWVIESVENGRTLVIRKTPSAMAVKTKRKDFVSINDSAEREQAGWALDERLVQAIRGYKVDHVGIYVPKPGMLFTADAKLYTTPGVSSNWRKSAESKTYRFLGLNHFTKCPLRVRL